MKTKFLICTTMALVGSSAWATSLADAVPDDVIAAQNTTLSTVTKDKGYGPQSPRDIDNRDGANTRVFSVAPKASQMTLCDIHFHENAEHKGGEFTTYAGNGDGKGTGTGFRYDGTLSEAELEPLDASIGAGAYGDLAPGDTIEIHFVHSTAQASLGNGLGTCLNEATGNPQLRVEAVVAVLVNDDEAADFAQLAKIEQVGGLNQAPNLPDDLGSPVVYTGSTTGPGYNEIASPLKVTWSVRPRVVKVNITSVGAWLADNPFDEKAAQGVRNLVVDPALLSPIE